MRKKSFFRNKVSHADLMHLEYLLFARYERNKTKIEWTNFQAIHTYINTHTHTHTPIQRERPLCGNEINFASFALGRSEGIQIKCYGLWEEKVSFVKAFETSWEKTWLNLRELERRREMRRKFYREGRKLDWSRCNIPGQLLFRTPDDNRSLFENPRFFIHSIFFLVTSLSKIRLSMLV